MEIKKAIEEVLQHSPGYGQQKTPQIEKNPSTFSSMEKNSFFMPPSEVINTAYDDSPMESEDNPSSAENTLVRATLAKVRATETALKNFESAYKTLPLPSSVTARVLNFETNSQTPTSSEEESQTKTTKPPLRQSIFTLPSPIKKASPPQTLLPKRKNTSPPEILEAENDGEDESDKDNTEFQMPRKYKKFKTNFVKLLERKAAASIPLANKYDSLSESEAEPEQNTATTSTTKGKATPNLPIKSSTTESGTTTDKTDPKTNKKSSIPPIVVDGRTDNHATLTSDLKAIIKGKYSVKYTNSTTVIFTEEQEDYELGSIKQAEIPHHTYTNKADKTHAFVLRGLGNGTEKEAIEEDLIASYEIKPRDIFKMTTKHRPLFLAVTDPVITLDYLNKNMVVVDTDETSLAEPLLNSRAWPDEMTHKSICLKEKMYLKTLQLFFLYS
ncbi:unnamed protein product [Psylliodes chrysocephalus]|uniref:Uncharacterized protein n=1 Tax=Psylliodes chrysocephalus TaxID=3402493 RepID=A0A9P0CWA4_9CUCU|nr:unnamed protein product [Psylliodes chrysocephala]